MKLKAIIFLFALSLLVPLHSSRAATSNNLNGRILLQVESKGEAWYVNPKDGKRYYMANGDQAFQIMKNLGIGVSNKNIDRIKTDADYRKKFIGKILLQVESKGEAYYISSDGRYNYLKDGASAYQVMRKLGLGVSNANLNKIAEYKTNIKTEAITPINSKVANSTKTTLSKMLDMPKQVISTTTTIGLSKKLYKNDTFKFQFEFPNNLPIKESSANTLGINYFKVITQDLRKNYSANYSFEVFVTRDDVKDPFSKEYENCKSNSNSGVICERIKLQGQDAVKIYRSGNSDSAQYNFLYKDYILNVGVYISGATDDDYGKMALEIFDSFKLLQ